MATKKTDKLDAQVAQMKKNANRVNHKSTIAPPKSRQVDLAPLEIRKHNPYTPRRRLPNEALPITHNTLMDRECYTTGMGDTAVAVRPGSMDYKKCPSRGL